MYYTTHRSSTLDASLMCCWWYLVCVCHKVTNAPEIGVDTCACCGVGSTHCRPAARLMTNHIWLVPAVSAPCEHCKRCPLLLGCLFWHSRIDSIGTADVALAVECAASGDWLNANSAPLRTENKCSMSIMWLAHCYLHDGSRLEMHLRSSLRCRIGRVWDVAAICALLIMTHMCVVLGWCIQFESGRCNLCTMLAQWDGLLGALVW